MKSITEVSIQVPYCDERGVCRAKYEPFCGHELGQTDPRCQRCNVRFPLPEPPCIDYEVGKGTLNLEKCCDDLFNGRIGEELKQEVSTTVSTVSSVFDLELLQNFTIEDCKLSGLHLPWDAPPRTLFEKQFCCTFGKIQFISFGENPAPTPFGGYCHGSPPVTDGSPLQFSSSVTGIGSLKPHSLGQTNPTCSTSECKRPSQSRPEKTICCLLIPRGWGNRRIGICPYSCD